MGHRGRDGYPTMPQVIVTAGAVTGLSRCRSFLEDNSPSTVIISGAVIEHYFQVLESEPEIGRPCEDNPDWRELLIPFGKSGYVARYFYDGSTVYVLAFRHQKEAGY